MTRAWTSDLSRRPSGRQRKHARSLRRNLTEPEKKLWWHLRQRFPLTLSHFRRQVPVGCFTNREVMTDIESVLDTIFAKLSAGSLPLAGRD